MEAWYKVVTPRKEVREGRSFNPDEFAIHLEQVVAGTAPEDYREPVPFFSRTCFTTALRNHLGMVLRRLAGQTQNSAPVLTLITQFGGGKTHALTALYHLARSGPQATAYNGIGPLLNETGVAEVPKAVGDSPRLTLVLMDPGLEWTGSGALRQQVAAWTRRRGTSDRLYPGSLVWCFRKPGRDLTEKVENWLAWKRVADDLDRGELGGEYDRTEMADGRRSLAAAEEDARDEVWAA